MSQPIVTGSVQGNTQSSAHELSWRYKQLMLAVLPAVITRMAGSELTSPGKITSIANGIVHSALAREEMSLLDLQQTEEMQNESDSTDLS